MNETTLNIQNKTNSTDVDFKDEMCWSSSLETQNIGNQLKLNQAQSPETRSQKRKLDTTALSPTLFSKEPILSTSTPKLVRESTAARKIGFINGHGKPINQENTELKAKPYFEQNTSKEQSSTSFTNCFKTARGGHVHVSPTKFLKARERLVEIFPSKDLRAISTKKTVFNTLQPSSFNLRKKFVPPFVTPTTKLTRPTIKRETLYGTVYDYKKVHGPVIHLITLCELPINSINFNNFRYQSLLKIDNAELYEFTFEHTDIKRDFIIL
ncbi:hypothetical protein HZS_86 [Henneguya salminicola]|nr:hypothetical protein HZS_86 [Henneguya salminicola]